MIKAMEMIRMDPQEKNTRILKGKWKIKRGDDVRLYVSVRTV